MDPLPLGRCSEKNFSTPSHRCDRWASLVCSHCNEGVCHEHHQIHQNQNKLCAHRLNNQINDLRHKFFALTDSKLVEEYQGKLDQWKEKFKNEIDLKHEKMSSQLSNVVEHLNLDEFRSKQLNYLDDVVGQPLTNLLRLANPNEIQLKHLQQLEEQMKQVQQSLEKLSNAIRISQDGQLIVDQSMLTGKNAVFSSSSLDLCFSSLQSKINLRDCPGAVGGSFPSSNYFLVFQCKPCFNLVLFDDDRQIHRTSIDHFVNDICWSEISEVFLIATDYFLYEYSPMNKDLSQPYGNETSKEIFSSFACSSMDLYVLQKPEIILSQRQVKKPFEQRRQWSKNEILCEKNDRTIGSIRIDQEKEILALSIEQNDFRWRIDLFALDLMQRLYRGALLGFSNEIDRICCSMTPRMNDSHQWFIICRSEEKCQFVLLDQFGQSIDQIDGDAINFTLINSNRLILLNSTGIQIYQA